MIIANNSKNFQLIKVYFNKIKIINYLIKKIFLNSSSSSSSINKLIKNIINKKHRDNNNLKTKKIVRIQKY